MQPPKKPPTSAADLRNKSRNERQKAVLLGEVTRLHYAKSSNTLADQSRQLKEKSDQLCHTSKALIRESRTRRNT